MASKQNQVAPAPSVKLNSPSIDIPRMLNARTVTHSSLPLLLVSVLLYAYQLATLGLQTLGIADLVIYCYFFVIQLLRFVSFGRDQFHDIHNVVEFVLIPVIVVYSQLDRHPREFLSHGILRLLFCCNHRSEFFRVVYYLFLVRPSAVNYFQTLDQVLLKMSFIYGFSRYDRDTVNWVLDLLRSNMIYYPLNQIPSNDKETNAWIAANFSEESPPKTDIIQSISFDHYLTIKEHIKRRSYHHRVLGRDSIVSIEKTLQLHMKSNSGSMQYHRWDFNVFEFVAENQKALSVLSIEVLLSLNVFDSLSVDRDVFVSFINEIEKGYISTPYHSMTHATDVVQACFSFLSLPFLSNYLTVLDKFILIFSASIHDFNHPGTDNAFEIDTQSEKAILYNDRSVLENYHVASALSVMQKENLNPIREWNSDEATEFRKSVINSVLSTDMTHHSEIIAFLLLHRGPEPGISSLENQELLDAVLHVADISNPCRPLGLAIQWAKMHTEEQFIIGDRRKNLGLPLDPFMDRHQMKMDKNQIGFIDFIIRPIYEAFNAIVDCKAQLENLEANYLHWKNYAEQVPAVPEH